MWVQGQVMAMATDVAEFFGAALGLNLLFGMPMLSAGLATGLACSGSSNWTCSRPSVWPAW